MWAVAHGILFAVAAVVLSWTIALDPHQKATAAQVPRNYILLGFVIVLVVLALLQVSGAFHHLAP